MKNPLLFITEFCRFEVDIETFRLDVRELIKSACAQQKYGDSESYFYTYRCLLKILEAVHIIYKERRSLSKSTVKLFDLGVKDNLVGSQKPVLPIHFHNLSVKEINNTTIFFKDFFNYQTLNEWRLTFSRFAEYAYRKIPIDEVMEQGSEMVIINEYVDKLIEVIFFIDYIQSVTHNNKSNQLAC